MSLDNIGALANNVLKSTSDRMNFSDSPFETAVGAIAPMAAYAASPILGIVFFFAEAFGVGPGLIGRIIDQSIGYKSGGVRPVLDTNTVFRAASNIVDFLTEKIGGITSGAALVITEKEIRKAANLCLISSYSKNFVKLGATKEYWKNFWRGVVGRKREVVGRKRGIIKTLMGLIWTLAKGMLALGLLGGVVKTIAGKKEVITNPASFLPSIPTLGTGGETEEKEHRVSLDVPSSWLYYKNNKNDVQDTLIGHMNDTMPTFSNLFYKENGIQLYNSPQMRNLLRLIKKHNHAPVAHLNNKAGFVAPKLRVMMNKLMPSFKFSKVDKYKPEEQTGGVK